MTDTRFIHYSAQPLTEVRSVEQDAKLANIGKPRGLWFSAEPGS